MHVKVPLSNEVGKQLDPPAVAEQCKKQCENMRTKVGKNPKREKKSGAGQVERNVREQDIMETGSFLTQHIVRYKILASEEVSTSL